MTEFFTFMFNLVTDYIGVFNGLTLVIAGISVHLIDLIIGFLCISMIITVFWKGAKG